MAVIDKILVVKVWGGLGNQMFQYAAAKALSIEHNASLLIDTSAFVKAVPNETPRNYRLSVFPKIREEIIDIKDVNKIIPKFKIEFLNKLYKIVNKRIQFNKRYKIEHGLTHSIIKMNTQTLYLDGYWQSEKYFLLKSECIFDAFDLKYLRNDQLLQSTIEKINSQTSVSIHVRRGDYVTNSHANAYHGTCDLGYYDKAIARIVEVLSSKISFFIFSDDVAWCKQNLNIPYEHSYVVTTEDYHDLYLMSICKHNIIANSSFSWWGAWLNRNIDKKVVAPEKWFSNQVETDLIPKEWIKI